MLPTSRLTSSIARLFSTSRTSWSAVLFSRLTSLLEFSPDGKSPSDSGRRWTDASVPETFLETTVLSRKVIRSLCSLNLVSWFLLSSVPLCSWLRISWTIPSKFERSWGFLDMTKGFRVKIPSTSLVICKICFRSRDVWKIFSCSRCFFLSCLFRTCKNSTHIKKIIHVEMHVY